MSLKGFHILFIILAFLCTAGFWGWAVVFAERAKELGATSMGNFSGSLALALLVYGVWFVVRKSKTIHVV
jgi:O-antigen ligase